MAMLNNQRVSYTMIYHVDWENDDNSLELGQPGKLFSVTTLCKLPSIAMFQAVPIVMIDV